jgi:hypothetical protein
MALAGGSWLDTHINVVSVVIACFAVVFGAGLSITLWWKPRAAKNLVWRRLSAYRVVDAALLEPLGLKVSLGDVEIERPNLVLVEILNTGPGEIRADDWDDPIRWQFARAVPVSTKIERKPGASIRLTEGVAPDGSPTYLPKSLSQGEWIRFRFITDGEPNFPELIARLPSVSVIRDVTPKDRRRLWIRSKRPVWTYIYLALVVALIIEVRGVGRQWAANPFLRYFADLYAVVTLSLVTVFFLVPIVFAWKLFVRMIKAIVAVFRPDEMRIRRDSRQPEPDDELASK